MRGRRGRCSSTPGYRQKGGTDSQRSTRADQRHPHGRAASEPRTVLASRTFARPHRAVLEQSPRFRAPAARRGGRV